MAAAGRPAVDDVDLTIDDGEFMVLLGPSGCGKSTTLRMIAGLETITAGTLSIDGRVVNNVPAKDRDIAMVFQSYALYPHMTVADNLAFGLRRRSMPKAEIERRVAGGGGHPRPRAAAGAQAECAVRRPAPARGARPRHRARAARCSCSTSRCPTSTPRCASTRATRSSSCITAWASTMIYVTHDQVEAMTMGTRICVMNEARVAQIGAPLDVYRNPADTFVARFLGSRRR